MLTLVRLFSYEKIYFSREVVLFLQNDVTM